MGAVKPAAPIYLDNAASTLVDPRVSEVVSCASIAYYGNVSSSHVMGQQAAAALDEAKARLSQLLEAGDYEIVVTSGGTESDNLALMGAVRAAKRRGALLSSATEHQAVTRCLASMLGPGLHHRELGVDSTGLVRLDATEAALRRGAKILSVHTVNNETGVIQPIPDLAQLARKHGTIFHTDAVQALGKMPFSAKKLGADLISLSGHKIHGPKGVGLLLIRKGLAMEPLFHGGGQERGVRPGTQNLPGVLGFVKAVELLSARKIDQLAKLRKEFEQTLLARLPGAKINGAAAARCAAITSICLPFIDDSYLHERLRLSRLCVSSGSACASHSQEPSRVLLAMGLSPHEARASLRLSLSRFTTRAELQSAVKILLSIVAPFA